MSGSDTREFIGGGLRAVADPEFDTAVAERIANGWTGKPRTRLDFLTGDNAVPVGVPMGTISTSGWGQLVYQGLRDEGDDNTTHWAVVSGPMDAQGGRLYLFPNREHWDGGRAKQQAMYRLIHVYTDSASAAALQAEQLKRDLAAKQAQLDLANQQAAAGDIDQQILLAKAKAGGGLHAEELSLINNTLLTATSDYESAQNHAGKSVITAGTWELLAGAKQPADFNLPKPIIDASDGPEKLKIATDLYRQLVAAASEPFPDQIGHYSTGWKTAATLALQSLGLA